MNSVSDNLARNAYVSSANQLDEKKLATAAGATKCTRVDADAVRKATGYPIGGVPPFDHAPKSRILIDPDLLPYDGVDDLLWAVATAVECAMG